MVYEGVKFVTIKLPKDEEIEELESWCRRFHNLGLAPPYKNIGLTPPYKTGSYGNLSLRLLIEDMFLITASNSSLENPKFSLVYSVDHKEREVYTLKNKLGDGDPSSEAMLHDKIYQKRKDVKAIFHGHCDEISSNVKKFGIVETKEEKPYGTTELIEQVLEVLGKESFIHMKGHGFLSLGRNLDEAGQIAIDVYNKCL